MGVSAVLSLPTGAGKTTLAQLKTAIALLDGKKVLFLAPTHALVRQVTNDWRRMFPSAAVRNSFLFDGEYSEDERNVLSDVTVMTPERCLALLMLSPGAFQQVGLIILDECHILHARSLEDSYRATDALFCLLRLFESATEADFLLMSAMLENTADVAAWISRWTGRQCATVNDEWKPTRQIRSCVIYPSKETASLQQLLARDRTAARKTGRKAPGTSVSKELNAHPHGFFSLNQTWNTTQLNDYRVLPLSDKPVLLKANNYWQLTSNRNVVAASLATKLADAGIKTIVFTQQIPYTNSIAESVASEIPSRGEVSFTEHEHNLLNSLTEELGSPEHIYRPYGDVAGCHHGLLLEKERELVEGLFTRKDGIKVLVATPTLAQGMNLPAEAVIISGDERFDPAQNEQSRLEAHELLNAAGRAGRAGQSAQGFVLVIPGQVVEFNEEKSTLSPRWFTLQENVFSKSDQCLTIIDPFRRLIDAIHAGTLEDYRPVDYILRRIPYDVKQTPEENVARTFARSFAGHMALKHQALESFVQDIAEMSKRVQNIFQAPEFSENTWLLPLAIELGTRPEVLLQLYEYSEKIDPDWEVSGYLAWAFKNLPIEETLKPQTLDKIVKDLIMKDERKRRDVHQVALNSLECLLQEWIKGTPLNKIEMLTLTPSHRLGKCEKARKVALRWSADVAYTLGILTRLYRYRCESGTGIRMPVTLATLAACVRQGVDSPEKLAIIHVYGFDIARVQAHHIFENISDFIEEGEPFESFNRTLRRVRTAIRKKASE